MAIAVLYRPPAMTAEQYQQSWAGGAPVAPPPGLLFHAGLGEGTDFMTISVWETREAYDAFAPVFAGIMAAKGLRFGAPQILPVHQVLVPTGK
ncbi:MAG TPA: hypothetical protein VLA96_13240 [Terriglobales bacterium]|nr:hypothetical protein [Terriglobales bacterium]